MATTLDAHTIESKARALVDNRMSSVRALVTSRQAVDEARDALASAEAADVKAYRAALSDGWSADELRTLGLDEPHKKARVRRRAAARKPGGSRPATPQAQGEPSGAPDAEVSP